MPNCYFIPEISTKVKFQMRAVNLLIKCRAIRVLWRGFSYISIRNLKGYENVNNPADNLEIGNPTL
jgi:hypothetical protein